MTNFKFGNVFGDIKFLTVEDRYLKEVDVEKFIKDCEIGEDLVKCKSLYQLLEDVSEYTEETAKIVIGTDYVFIYYEDYNLTYDLKRLEISMGAI